MLPLIPQDKANHFVYGAAIYLVAALFFTRLMLPDWLALVLVVVAGVGKEVSDWLANRRAGAQVHGVELLDAVATFAGGLACFAGSLL